jgi:hypothetical protein
MQLIKLLRPGTNLKSSLETWLKTFATDATTNEAALSNYKEGMERLAEIRAFRTGSDIQTVGEHLVARAAESAAKLTRI